MSEKKNVWSRIPVKVRRGKSDENVWSPKPRSAYTVLTPEGKQMGLGSRSVFNGRPGLWNLVWLHSIRVDSLLDWQGPAEDAVGYTSVLVECEKSASLLIGGATTEYWAATLDVNAFIQKLRRSDVRLPIQDFWDDLEGDSWEQLVSERAKLSAQHVEQRGNVCYPHFC